jgi:hypothetical protein
MGRAIPFVIEPSQGNNTGYSFGREISKFALFPSGYSSFFITTESDDRFLANMWFDSTGAYTYGTGGSQGGGTSNGASANSVVNNLDNIIWSSWHFDYLEHITNATVSNVALNSQAVRFSGGKDSHNIPYTQTATYQIANISSLNLSFAPLFTLESSTYPTIGNQLVIKYGNDSYRILTPFSDTSQLAFNELVYVGNTAIPSLNLGQIKYYLIKTGNNASSVHDQDTNDLTINSSRVKIGRGKSPLNDRSVLFDTEREYIHQDNSGGIEFYTETQIGAIVGTDLYSAGNENTFSSFANINVPLGQEHMYNFTHDPSRWNVTIFINKSGSVIYSESSKSSPMITHTFEASAMTQLVGSFQGNVIRYEVD